MSRDRHVKKCDFFMSYLLDLRGFGTQCRLTPRPYLVLLSAPLLVVLQDVVPNVVLGVDQQRLGLALLLSPLHPHHKQQDHACANRTQVNGEEALKVTAAIGWTAVLPVCEAQDAPAWTFPLSCDLNGVKYCVPGTH